MDKTVIVSVKEGKLRGIRKKSTFSGAEFYSFYGIPYGEAPVKNLRFMDPVKAKPWKSIRNATIETNQGCTQFAFYNNMVLGSEDCLYTNIHTPKLPSEGVPLKAVIVCIHPGGFRFGSPETWHYGSPESIMHHDVVYVCIAFRLHILGFLNLNMQECSGNQGLKDIILGLKWVKENIHNFNGDPNNVTLFGASSGGCAINLLMMSPASKGLFHKAAMSSPTYTSLVYTEYRDENEKIAFRFGRMLGFKGSDRNKLLAFLKRIPAEVLTTSQREYDKKYGQTVAPVFPHATFLPTIDAASATPVIPTSPRKLIHSMTPVPLILGICERESVLGFATERVRTLTEKNYRKAYRQNWWSWMYDLNDDEMNAIHDQIERFYLKDCSFEDAPLSVKVDMLTEIAFHDLYDTLINPIAKRLPSSVYLYRYRFDGGMSTLKRFLSHTMGEKISGSYHVCDYACWCFVDKKSSKSILQIVETYTKLITTFAKNGDPNYEQFEVQWRPSTMDKPCYLCFGSEVQTVDGRFHNESVEFWKNIKKQFKKD